MKKHSKIIALALSLLMLVVACIGITASANEVEAEPEKSLAIISQNVSYSEKMYLYFAVYYENVDTDGLVLNVYSSDPEKNEGAQLLAAVTEHDEVVIPDVANGTSYTCRAFETPGVALKNLATEYFVQAVAKDGTKSAVRRYSVVEYLNEMIFLSKNADEIAAYKKLLAAGDAAQYLLNYYPNDNENDIATNYAYVKVTDGIVTGEYKKGTYLVGEELSLTYTGTEDIKSWKLLNANGELVAQIAYDTSFTVSESVLCVPSAEEPPAPSVRGTGVYANDANTLNFTGVNANDLKTAGKLITSAGSPTFEGSGNINASVVAKGGDNALKLSIANSTSSSAYYALKSANGTAQSLGGTKYVFETDIYIEAASSTRSNNAFLAIADAYDSKPGENASCAKTILFKAVDGKYQIAVNGTQISTDVNAGEWFTLRVEYGASKTNDTIRYYVNGECIGEYNTDKLMSTVGYLRLGLLDKGTCEVYFDNTCFMAIK